MDEQLLGRMDSQLAGWSDPVARLRQAIERDEFALFCQPMLALAGGGEADYPMGEVLVRMREEERALLPPGEFLPVMEHYRMMPQLDRWVVRDAVRHLAAGSRIGCFTVNVSGQTLQDAAFVRFTVEQLGAHGIPAQSIGFEIDENDTLLHLDAARRFAAEWRAVGGRLLIDSFGRRSVSFAAIKSLGVTSVKVDGCITRKLLTSEVARTKMSAILRVGEGLGFSVVAECVEEQDVLLRLKALGVRYAQGFGIYQPHPITSFRKG